MGNDLAKFAAAWAGSSFLVALPVALTMGMRAVLAEKTYEKAVGGFIVIFSISFLIGLISILLYSLPLFLITWIPLWFLRKEVHVFDYYSLAGITGLALGFMYWLILSHFDPHFRETLNRELTSKILFCSATVGGGGIMFLFGCFFNHSNRLPL
jgi:hypothetical protein